MTLFYTKKQSFKDKYSILFVKSKITLVFINARKKEANTSLYSMFYLKGIMASPHKLPGLNKKVEVT